MATDDIERLHYYQRQYLGALDFEDQQTYHRDMRRRLNLAHHTWGIVTGLELQETKKPGTNAVDIYINPGMAIDGYGREIVLFQQTQLDVSLFQPYRTVTRIWTVCLKYFENFAQRPLSGYEQCDVPNQFGRVQENYRIVLANPDPIRDDLTAAGNAVQAPPLNAIPVNPYPEDQPILPLSPPPGTSNLKIPYDESLPYQEFPVDDPATLQFAQWLIPLGQVSWDGSLQSLIQDVSIPPTPPIYVFGRRYVGAVASRLLAPARTLVVRDRSSSTTLPFRTSIELKREPPPPTPPNPDGVTMIVEGTLEVDRTLKVDGVLYAEDNIQLDGGTLDFRDVNGSSDGKGGTDPLFTITRQGKDTTTGIALRIQIGKDNNGKNSFAVGTDVNYFTVADNGNAYFAGPLDVKTNLTIEGILDFGTVPREMIKLWATSDNKQQNGIGIVMGAGLATTYFRSSSEYWWFRGGAFTAGQSDPGSGAQVQLKLDADGSLHFDNDTDAPTRWRQMLNLSSTSYGIGVQDSTLYFRSGSDFCWFLGGLHNPGKHKPGTGGTLQMKLGSDGNLYFDNEDATARTRQMLNLWQKSYGLGVQSSTLYYRSNSDFCWFKGGSHSDTQSDPGGGTLQMILNTDGALNVFADHAGHIAFVSNTDLFNNQSYSVTLGYVSPGHHGSDSIYGYPNLWLDAYGSVMIKHGFQTPFMDGAEHFPFSEPVEPGDVVVLSAEGGHSVKPAESAYNTSVVGVVSTDPAFILGGPASAGEIEAVRQNNVAVALIGTVPCKVDADIAPIHIGDLLTTSPTKGYAQRVLDSSKATGAVLGKAMGSLENGKGVVSILVMMS